MFLYVHWFQNRTVNLIKFLLRFSFSVDRSQIVIALTSHCMMSNSQEEFEANDESDAKVHNDKVQDCTCDEKDKDTESWYGQLSTWTSPQLTIYGTDCQCPRCFTPNGIMFGSRSINPNVNDQNVHILTVKSLQTSKAIEEDICCSVCDYKIANPLKLIQDAVNYYPKNDIDKKKDSVDDSDSKEELLALPICYFEAVNEYIYHLKLYFDSQYKYQVPTYIYQCIGEYLIAMIPGLLYLFIILSFFVETVVSVFQSTLFFAFWI